MKKLIILLTALLSLNLFGGLVHPKLNTIGTLKGGMEFLRGGFGGTIEPSIEFKTYLFEHERLNIYFSGKLADEIGFNKNKIANNIKLVASFGTERNYDVVKFYQQLGFGIGYYTENLHDSKYDFLSVPIEIELGTNYQNYLISLTLGSDVLLRQFNNGNAGNVSGDITLKLGLGYEF